MNNKVAFTLRIDEEMLKQVRLRAVQEGTTISDWICKSIELSLEYGIIGSLENEERL